MKNRQINMEALVPKEQRGSATKVSQVSSQGYSLEAPNTAEEVEAKQVCINEKLYMPP